MKMSYQIRFKGQIYRQVLTAQQIEAMSSEPLKRALERIQQLKDRGADPRKGTMSRLLKTQNPGKIMGIALAAKRFHWDDIINKAKTMYKDIVGQPLKV